MFNTGIGSVHPAGGSPSQAQARTNTRNEGYRQQIIATRQIVRNQEPRALSNPRQDVAAVQHRQQQAARADVRAQHIAAQQVQMVQDQNPNPAKANRILFGQAVQQLRRVNDIGRLSKIATTTSNPLEHRVGALRTLRTRYGIPVTQQNFTAFRQAQAFHQFLHDGKEGDTITVPGPTVPHMTKRGTQMYQLRKVQGRVLPVRVAPERHLSLSGALSGHPYKTSLVPQESVHDALAQQTGIAPTFVNAAIDTAHYGAKAIPEGTVGTPLRRAVTELAAIGPNTITGLYGLASAGVSAATGNTKPIKAIAKSFSENDPLGRLVTHGDFKAFAAHPGIAIAEVAGGLAAADRLAGNAARGGPQEIRSYRSAPGTRLAVQERYSQGAVVSRLQKAHDLRTDTKFADLRSQAEAEVAKAEQTTGDVRSGHLKKAHDLAAQAEKYNRNRLREGFDVGSPHRTQLRGDLERLGDVTEGTNQFAQRKARAQPIRDLLGKHAIRESKREAPIIRRNDAESEVQGLVAEGRVAADRGELTKVADRLETQAQHLTDHHEIATNRHIVGSIREVLRTHNDQQLRVLAEDAMRYAKVNRKAHDLAKEHSLGTAEEFDMSSAKPHAVEQIGARPDAEGILRKAAPGVSEEDMSNAIRDVARTEASARSLRSRGSAVDRNRLANAEAEASAAQAHLDTVAPRLRLGQIHQAMNAYADKFPGLVPRAGEEAFVSHSSRIKGGGVYNRRADAAQGLSRARRTGAAVVHGTASVGRDAMLGSVVKLHVLTQQVKSFRQMLKDAAGRDPARTDPLTGHVGIIQENTAQAALKKWNDMGTDPKTGLPKPGFVEGLPIRLNPLGGRPEQLAHTLHEVDEEGFLPGEHQPVSAALQAALEGKDVGSGQWTVIPRDYALRQVDHSKVASGGSPFFRTISSAFRKTVLPFSPTWITGNVLEANLRGAIAGWRPGDSELENRVIGEWSKLDPERAARATLAIGYGHFGSADLWKIKNTANSLKGPLKPIYALGDKLLHMKRGGKEVQIGVDGVRAYTDWMMNSVNGQMESAIKRGMVGTEMRKLFLPRDLSKTTEEAIRSIAGELHSNPAAVHELITSLQRSYGAYEHFSPEMRRTIINYTPFGAWVFNAVTFLVRVLPADHPGLTALLAANASATQQYRRDAGLDATLADEKGGGQVPPFLMGSIPTPAWYARLTGVAPGSPLRLARYTPFGIATDPTSTFASMFLPQIPLEYLQGYDFAGRPLRNKDGTPKDASQLATAFGLNFALGTIPLFGQLLRGIQKGPLAVVNPLQPVATKSGPSATTGGLPSFGSSGTSKSAASGGLPAFKP